MFCKAPVNSSFHCLKLLQKLPWDPNQFLNQGSAKDNVNDFKTDFIFLWFCSSRLWRFPRGFPRKAAIWTYSQISLNYKLKGVHFTIKFCWLTNIRVTWFHSFNWLRFSRCFYNCWKKLLEKHLKSVPSCSSPLCNFVLGF